MDDLILRKKFSKALKPIRVKTIQRYQLKIKYPKEVLISIKID